MVGDALIEVLSDIWSSIWGRFRTSRLMMWFMRVFMIIIITTNSLFNRVRMSHENGLVVRGRVVLLDNPAVPANDFFVGGREYPCRLRHAAVSFLDDASLVVRSASLKFADAPINSPLDLLMNTGVAGPFWNMDTFWQFTRAKMRGGRAELIEYFMRNPRCYWNVRSAVRRDPNSFANQHFHSQTPLQFFATDGRERYAKFRLVPKVDALPQDGVPTEADLGDAWFQEPLPNEALSKNYLKDEYRARLTRGPVHYVLQLQLLEWSSVCDRDYELSALFPWDEALQPWQPVAEVTITDALGYHEGNLCLFSLCNLPKTLKTIPPRGYTDGPSIDYLRLGGMWPRKARLWAYSIFGQNKPIPDERTDTADEYADHTTAAITSDDVYMRPSLPQSDPLARQMVRAQLLEAQRGMYQFIHGFFRTEARADRPWRPLAWYRQVFKIYESDPKARKTVELPLPPFVKSLPPQENYTPYILGRMYKIIGSSVVSIVLGFVQKWLLAWRGLDAYKLLILGNFHKPLSMARWRDDVEFARQRLDGINPGIITRFDKIPAHFPVTDALVEGLLDEEETLATAIAAKRLYVCDYGILEGISVKPGKHLCCPIVLMYVGADQQLRPIAIQLYQTAEQGPIFTPLDPPGTWLAVKTFAQSADAQVHEVIEHLLHGHLIIEVFDVAVNRTLSRAHPVHQLLAPHLEFTMAVNKSARTVMLAPGGPIDLTMAIGAKGAFELLARGWWDHWDFARHNIPADIAARGVGDVAALPGYHWRDDALQLWKVMGRYVTNMVHHFYQSDADVLADTELQAFHHEMRSNTGGAVRGLPGGDAGFIDRTVLIELLTRLIYAASAGHAAGNNGQYDYYGFIPNTPGAMYRAPPKAKSEIWRDADLAKAMPDFETASIQIIMVRLLSRGTEMPLGQFPHSFFAASDEVLPIITDFRQDLHRLSAQIEARNASLAVPYTYLNPKQVACSITA
ncbi:lipoxygenase family protein [Tabrizicola sp.]|uniref:lipoxygenase family protein n=1 Tax=Tabrizicola sp. TaxID=2005166 RepID=UPI00286C688E|nr:lipoxygenase family protein [Tabrizicola sp.]